MTDIPGYADNHIKIGRMAMTLKTAGYVGLTLDVANSGLNIHQACTVDQAHDHCARTSFREGGRLAGSVAGGALGGLVGIGVCSLVFAIPSGGTSPLWCGIILGGAGGYLGSRVLSNSLANRAELLYEYNYTH